MHLNIYAVSALINAIISIVLGFFVLSKNPKGKMHIGFFLFTLSMFIWSLPYYLWQTSNDPQMALLWCRVLMAGAIFIPITYLHFTYALVGLLHKRKTFLIFSYILFFLFFLSDFTPVFVSHMEPLMNFPYWPIAGPAFSLFLILWVFYAYYSAYILIKHYRISSGLVKAQLKYVTIGTFLGWTGGITNYFLWYRIPIPPFGNITAAVYLIFVAYAIAKYRLMDIRIVARKIFYVLGSATFVYAVFYLLILFSDKVLGGAFSGATVAFGLIIAPVFVLGFYRVDKGLKNFANRYLFVSLYNYQETINKLNDELTNHIELNKIIDLIVDTIKDTMQLDRAGVLLVNTSVTPIHYQIAKVIGFNESNGVSLVQDNFLTQHLLRTQKLLVSDELVILARDSKNSEEKKSFLQLYENMKHIEASLCLPLISNGMLIGIIVLGSKVSGDAYTKEDLELLSTLAKQAGIAIENARLYKEVQDFNITLKQKVDEQTKDIQEKAERLEKLLKVKSEFIYLMSHQLRTPISVITGMTSMMKDGDLEGMPPEKRQEFIDGIYTKSRKLADILNDFIKAESMDGEEFKFAPEDIIRGSGFPRGSAAMTI